MTIDEPIRYAKSCRNKREAAKLACAIESEISYGNPRHEDWYDNAEQALAILRTNHPGFWELDAYQAPPGLSRGFRETERTDDESLDLPSMPVPKSQRAPSLPRLPRSLAIIIAGIIAITLIATQIPGPTSQALAQTPVTLHLGPWEGFLAACEAGPSPGQGNTAEACGCWRSNLQKAAILPTYALEVLNSAELSGGQAYMVPENIGNVAINQAMNGCGLYTETT